MNKMPPSESGRKRMWACRLSEAHHARLEAIADAEFRPKTDVIRWLIDHYFDEHVRRKGKARR